MKRLPLFVFGYDLVDFRLTAKVFVVLNQGVG